jgi:recombinational DNA repair protein (RecF pathway)
MPITHSQCSSCHKTSESVVFSPEFNRDLCDECHHDMYVCSQIEKLSNV